MGDPKRGLYRKFEVRRTDGSSEEGGKHHGCDYFVLDMVHDKHAQAAIAAYADSCEAEYPLLAIDLRLKYGVPAVTEKHLDSVRLDVLAQFVLNVRRGCVYGSLDAGWYSPPFDEDGSPNGQPDLRTWIDTRLMERNCEIDAAMQASPSAPSEGERGGDGVRLDAVLRNQWFVVKSPHRDHGLKAFICGVHGPAWPDCVVGTGDTEREAIDAAIAAQEARHV